MEWEAHCNSLARVARQCTRNCRSRRAWECGDSARVYRAPLGFDTLQSHRIDRCADRSAYLPNGTVVAHAPASSLIIATELSNSPSGAAAIANVSGDLQGQMVVARPPIVVSRGTDLRFWCRIAVAAAAALLVGAACALLVLRAGGWWHGFRIEVTILEWIHTPIPRALDWILLLLPW